MDGEDQQQFSAVEGEHTCLVASHQEGGGQVLGHEVQPKIYVTNNVFRDLNEDRRC